MNRLAKILALPAALAIVVLPGHAFAASPISDTACGGQFATIVVGAHSAKTVTGTEGDDVIVILKPGHVVRSLGGNDRICGSGEDTIDGGGGADHLYGGSGSDRVKGGPANDTLLGGSGNDVLSGGAGNDTEHGDAGDDTLWGGDGDDRIDGGEGHDAFHGGKGKNREHHDRADDDQGDDD